MSLHFSAHQFEHTYRPTGLSNWEYPKYHPRNPRKLQGTTKSVVNNKGYLVPSAKTTGSHCWSNYCSTYELPNRITRQFVAEYNECLATRNRFKGFKDRNDPCNLFKPVPLEVACMAGLGCPPKKCDAIARLIKWDKAWGKRVKEPTVTELLKANPRKYKWKTAAKQVVPLKKVKSAVAVPKGRKRHKH